MTIPNASEDGDERCAAFHILEVSLVDVLVPTYKTYVEERGKLAFVVSVQPLEQWSPFVAARTATLAHLDCFVPAGPPCCGHLAAVQRVCKPARPNPTLVVL